MKLPWSLATEWDSQYCSKGLIVNSRRKRTDLDIGALVVGNTRVGGAYRDRVSGGV